jgi:hypothetical protein
MNHGKTSRIETPLDYGLGLEVVVVVVVELDEFGGVATVVVLVVVSLVFSVVAGGFTIVVFFSVFAGAGELAGATTSVFCSQAPRSAALAKMQSNFFIVWIGCPILGQW